MTANENNVLRYFSRVTNFILKLSIRTKPVQVFLLKYRENERVVVIEKINLLKRRNLVIFESKKKIVKS